MKFQFAPKANYRIGQRIAVNGLSLMVESYSHTGKNLIAVTLPGAPKFQRIMVILTDSKPVCACEVTA